MLVSLERVTILALVVYRLAVLLAYDDGPAEAFERFRRWLGRRAVCGVSWRFLADVVHCPRCSSVWLSAVLSPYMFLTVPAWIDAAFCVIAAAGLVYVLVEMGKNGGA